MSSNNNNNDNNKIIIISTFAVRHICAGPSVRRQTAVCRSVCTAAQYAFLILTLDGREW